MQRIIELKIEEARVSALLMVGSKLRSLTVSSLFAWPSRLKLNRTEVRRVAPFPGRCQRGRSVARTSRAWTVVFCAAVSCHPASSGKAATAVRMVAGILMLPT
jgi:hypothetical protein